MDHLNLFLPFENKNAGHEDVLTRNFLFLIKAVPAVRRMVSNLILVKTKACGNHAFDLLPATFEIKEVYTQVDSGNGIFNRLGDSVILSSLISDDTFEQDCRVEFSDRHARYDGILVCDPKLWIVIENKPYVEDVWKGQLNLNLEGNGKNEKLIRRPCCLSWRDIVSGLNRLLVQSGLNGTEKMLLDDFLMYIDEEYPALNPFDRLDMCKNVVSLMDKRCRGIMEELWHKKTQYHKGWKWYIPSNNPMIKEIALASVSEDNEWCVRLFMHFGVTQSAAQKLYANINENCLGSLLSDPRMSARGAFHYAVRADNKFFPEGLSSTDVREYVKYWKQRNAGGQIHQIKRNTFLSYHQQLITDKIVSATSVTDFQRKILTKGYQKLNVCPELQICYTWPKEEAIKLDKNNVLVDSVVEKVRAIMSIFNAYNDVGLDTFGVAR